MSLNLNDHLLQAPDKLLTPLLGHLCLEVVLATLTDLLGPLLVVLAGVGRDLLLEVGSRDLSAGARVGLGSALLLVLSCTLSCIGRVTRAIRVGCLGGVTASLLDILLADGNARLELLLKVVLVKVGSLVPGVVVGGSVDVLELLVCRVDLVRRLLCSIASNVAKEDAGVAKELAELAIGNEKRAEGTKAVESLIAVLPSSLLVDRSTRHLGVTRTNLLSLPDEVLDQVALVLGEKQDLGLLDDLLEIVGELLSSVESLLLGDERPFQL